MQTAEQPLRMHVAEILDRKRRLAVVLGRARREHARAELPGLFDHLGFAPLQPERDRIEDGSVLDSCDLPLNWPDGRAPLSGIAG